MVGDTVDSHHGLLLIPEVVPSAVESKRETLSLVIQPVRPKAFSIFNDPHF